jgi:hypothetical protein
MRKIIYITVGTIVIACLAVLTDSGSYIFSGNPQIPDLESHWWGGYYNTEQKGRQRCVARFANSDAGLEMAMISSWGPPVVFKVIRSSPSPEFVNLLLIGPKELRIEATQLYAGKRYYLQRLGDHRFKDFWGKNDDISIRGKTVVSTGQYAELAIEPLNDREMKVYWKKYVRPDLTEITPRGILDNIGFDYK